MVLPVSKEMTVAIEDIRTFSDTHGYALEGVRGSTGPMQRDNSSKPQHVVELILRRLADGEWQVGDKLPSERTFATEFGVSRGVVREALKALHLSGHIDTRLSEGSFVRMSRSMSRTMEAATVVADLSDADGLEVRQGLEIACACLAINRATPADLLRMDAAVLDMEASLDANDFTGFLAATLPFHMSIASAAHSPALLELTTTLMKSHRTDEWIAHDTNTAQYADYSLAVHKALASAVREHDMQAAVAAVTKHYEDYPVLQTLSDQ
ncbi:MAG: FadR family transcriptional regulator [Subtercola sp.]|jgi:DNA-binding FadR family transcriptional regulator|nr:FadR family transcriptional regulator [Subtercola sp.]